MDPDRELSLYLTGRRRWVFCPYWRQIMVEVGYEQDTTTPPWSLVAIWRVGLRWPPVQLLTKGFTTPEMMDEELKRLELEEKGGDTDEFGHAQ